MKYTTYIELLLNQSIPNYIISNEEYKEYVEMLRDYYKNDEYTQLIYNKHYKNLDSYLLDLEVNRLIPNLPKKTALRKDKICHFTSGNISNIDNTKIIKGITGKETQIIDNNQLVLATSDNKVIYNTIISIKGLFDNDFITINGNKINVNTINYKQIDDVIVSYVEINEYITDINSIDGFELHKTVTDINVDYNLKNNSYDVFDENDNNVGTITINRSNQIGDISVVELKSGYSLNDKITFPEIENFDGYVSLVQNDIPVLVSFNRLGKTNLTMPIEIENNGIKVKLSSKIDSITGNITLLNSNILHVLEDGKKITIDVKTSVINNQFLDSEKGLTSSNIHIFNGAEYGNNGITVRNGEVNGNWINYSKKSNTHAFSNVIHEIIEVL